MSEPSPAQERGAERLYANGATEVNWEPKRCTHVRNRVRGLPRVFDPDRRPWIDADAAEPDAIAAMILTCPTGALHFRRLDSGAHEEAQAETTVETQPDGPFFVRGRIGIVHACRLIREDTWVAVCRCGASSNKSVRDGSHRRIDFRSVPEEVEARR